MLADLAMDPLDPLPFHLTHQLLDELPAETIDELMAKVGHGLTSRCSSSATWAARWRARRPAPVPARRCPARSARWRSASSWTRRPTSRCARRSPTFDAARAPHRAGDYPNFVEEPADASRFFAPAVWERLREVKSRYDPTDMFVGNHHIPPAERL